MTTLVQFAFLQTLDILTTLVFLSLGVQEANPLVQWAMAHVGTAAGGLLLVKVAAIGLALFCWRRQRMSLLSRANLFFTCLVLWNLTAIGLQMA